MAEIIEGISPTRMELLKLGRRIKLAEKGHKLLKEKRDALVSEFLDVVQRVHESRDSTNEKLAEAFKDLIMAQAVMGSDAVWQISQVTGQEIKIDVDTMNIMGVKVPMITTEDVKRSMIDRGYGFADTSSKIDDAARNFEEAIGEVIKLAEVQQSVESLASEVIKTKRRVNALEYIVIPRLKATAIHIRMRLAEMERENFTRLKKIKAAIEAGEEGAEAA
ncbi:MAG: V-type ATP synthase subunit D [Methanothrix sp.]|jgi:V/A-type H+-transporting ATPase subunit D|uniref:A-type ATP synthase subunit D n=1 Tax=Methanothrix harundinacea TaxID=301375 RepID=A0A124G3L9_9EURY|nr:MAG: ATP synthase subunit D [Methanosaeta sp. SDB]KUK44163.1 MAG: V-type ATP synthase subunit D [Methanothrix harundinacea]MDD2638378.1 V-type ATP synthase subunit D [Methanothrix sp.]MDI9397990.1 V-type ATP synthase subunit D [Euryarchaeota archaeon]KUK97315.1 MAG: V-type ATP synthase subunit D [Methanothrix harundinacea]